MNFSIASLATTSGCALALPWIIEGIKRIAGVEINTWYLRLIVFLSGLAILDVALLFIGWDWQQFALNFINALVVYFVATGEYHTIIKSIQGNTDSE